MKAGLWLGLCVPILLLKPEPARTQSVQITAPPKDSVMLDHQLEVRGRAKTGSVVKVSIGDLVQFEKVIDGSWRANFKHLRKGTNVVQAEDGVSVDRILVTVAANVKANARQGVRFVWTPGAEKDLAEIADKTLDTLSRVPQVRTAQLCAFTIAVRHRTEAVVIAAHKGIGLDFENRPGVKGHVIEMLPTYGSFFGTSEYDCGNTDPAGKSEVWVGSFRESMVKRFANWGPMNRKDDLHTRIEDCSGPQKLDHGLR